MNLCVAQTSLPSTHIATSSLGKKSASYPLGLHITETRRRFSPLSALTTLPIPLSRRGDVLVDLITAPGKLPPSRANWPNLTDEECAFTVEVPMTPRQRLEESHCLSPLQNSPKQISEDG